MRVGVTGKTRAEVRRTRDELLVRHRAAMLPAPAAGRQPTAAYLRSWLSGKRGTIEPGTWARYRLAVERHLTRLLGQAPLGLLVPDDVRGAYAALRRPPFGLAPASVRQAHVVPHQAPKQAVRDGLLPRNVAEAVDPPKVGAPRVRALTPAEVVRVLTKTSDDWRTRWLVAAHAGLRLGELLGLAWDDVAWDGRAPGGGAITVRRVPAPDAAQLPYLRPYPKSRSGGRVVPVGAGGLDVLRRHRQRQLLERAAAPRGEDTGGLVFLSRFGTMLLKSNVIRAFKRDAAAAGIAGVVSPHVLRHTFASSLLAAGRPVPEVAYPLGHGSPAVTMRVHVHVVPGSGEDVATALARFYAAGATAPESDRQRPAPAVAAPDRGVNGSRPAATAARTRTGAVAGALEPGLDETPAQALRDLKRRRHRAAQPAEPPSEARWRLTPAGAAYLAGLRDGEEDA